MGKWFVMGEKIQVNLDNVAISEAKIKRKDRITGLDMKVNSVLIDKKPVTVNPNLLFNRLSALAGREENVEKYFDYELTPYPMSLFKDGCMRKADKAALRSLILTEDGPIIPGTFGVIDGGALLHQIHWPPNTTYSELLGLYVKSVRQQFGDCHVVFDGYDQPSIKDHEHIRRSTQVKTPDI